MPKKSPVCPISAFFDAAPPPGKTPKYQTRKRLVFAVGFNTQEPAHSLRGGGRYGGEVHYVTPTHAPQAHARAGLPVP
jgi:hypothetical protein